MLPKDCVFSVILILECRAYLKNEFRFSEVYRSVNYIGSRAK